MSLDLTKLPSCIHSPVHFQRDLFANRFIVLFQLLRRKLLTKKTHKFVGNVSTGRNSSWINTPWNKVNFDEIFAEIGTVLFCLLQMAIILNTSFSDMGGNEDDEEDRYVPYDQRPETYIVPVVFLIILVVGVTGNGILVLTLLRHANMRNVPNTYVLSLALGDLLVRNKRALSAIFRDA